MQSGAAVFLGPGVERCSVDDSHNYVTTALIHKPNSGSKDQSRGWRGVYESRQSEPFEIQEGFGRQVRAL